MPVLWVYLVFSCFMPCTSQGSKLDKKVCTVQVLPLSKGPDRDQGSQLTCWSPFSEYNNACFKVFSNNF